jgi:diguanylate cyclase (GGDEF)-like protein/PAS domain S-box-containing protein
MSAVCRRRQTARLAHVAALLLTLVVAVLVAPAAALALSPIVLQGEHDRIEITAKGEAYEGRGDSLTVETAAGGDGVRGRMSVRAASSGTNPSWFVFALTNGTEKPIERWLTADRYTAAGSGVVWPDLDARRLEAVTPSIGFVPSRVKSDRADIFALTVEPGQTITYVVELATDRFPRISLSKPLEYEVKARDRQLFNGVMLGLTVLTAVFLTAIFAANHKIIFPAAALFSWCVLAYLCVDFGFFHKLFNLKPEDNAIYRAAAEASMAASLVMFLYAFLRLRLSHGLIRMLSLIWIVAQLSLVAVAAIDPRLAATFARFSFVGIGAIGALFTLYLAIRGQDRALHLVPTWILFLIWIFLAGVTLTGRLQGDIFVSALIAGLVMVVLLIGFTVTQFAFRATEPLAGLSPGDNQLRGIAVDGARSAVWEWSSRRDEIKTGAIAEEILGLNPGELSVKVDDFMRHVHASDRERFRLMLWSVQERAGGKIRAEFRMRHADNSYRWFELEAASVPTGDRRAVRCIGLMRDVTEVKLSHERLMHDAVHCSLTGLPNRALLLDRLAIVMQRAKTDPKVRPTIFHIDIDKFKAINATLGLNVGDSVLLTVARRLQRHLGAQDTLARVGGDQFAILFTEEQEARELAALAERVRRSLRSPIPIASQEVVMTGSLGIAIYDGEEASAGDLLKEAEIAMFRAKRGGTDRIEIFRPEMRSEPDDEAAVETMLRKAIDKGQLKMLFQPIVYLPTEELAGFEAFVRFDHPKLGLLDPAQYLTAADDAEMQRKLASFVLTRSAEAAVQWQKELPRPEDHLFVALDIASRELLRADLVQEVRHLLSSTLIAKGTLRLEVPESLAMENPEHACEMLGQLRGAGVEITLDDFGAGYSSLTFVQRFPCEMVKIDRTLLRRGANGDEAGASIVRAMVGLVHELGKKAIAEGIEQSEQVSFLRSMGCEFGQGFYYGEPMSDRDVTQLLRIIRKSERKLQTHGFFKTKQRSASKKRKREAEAQAQATAAGERDASAAAGAPATPTPKSPAERGAAPQPGLPNSTVRPRQRPALAGQQRSGDTTAAPAAASPAPATGANAANAARPPLAEQPQMPPLAAQPAQQKPASAAPPVPPARPADSPAAPNAAPPGPSMPPPSQPVSAAQRPQPPQAATSAPPPPAPPAAVQAVAPPPGEPPRPQSQPPRLQPITAPPPMPPRETPPPPRAVDGASRNGAPPEQAASMPRGEPPRQQPPLPPAPAAPPPADAAPIDARPRTLEPPPRRAPVRPQRVARRQEDYSTLPPGIAASLAKLAGVPSPTEPPADAEPRRKEPPES